MSTTTKTKMAVFAQVTLTCGKLRCFVAILDLKLANGVVIRRTLDTSPSESYPDVNTIKSRGGYILY